MKTVPIKLNRTIRLSNIRAFTGATPYSVSDNLGLKTKCEKYLYSDFMNADGAHPGEFNLDKYNSLISNANVNIDVLNSAISEVAGYVTEYKRQADYHFLNQGPMVSAKPGSDHKIALSWRDTAQRVKDELENRRNQVLSQSNSGTGNNSDRPLPPNYEVAPTKTWSPTKKIGTAVAGVAVLVGGFLFIKFLINRNKPK